MGFSSLDYRRVLGSFATGIAVVTVPMRDAPPVGVTVNSFTAVSLDPPLVSFCLSRDSDRFGQFVAADEFTVNILNENQEHLSAVFARALGDVDSRDRPSALRLPGCLAHVDCRRHAIVDAGDHVILVGAVVDLAAAATGRPLLFFRGRYERLPPD